MEEKYVWKIKSYKPYSAMGIMFCIGSGAGLFFLVESQPVTIVLPLVLFLGFAFLVGLYEILKGCFKCYPIQIKLCCDGMDIVYSKGKIKRISSEEIKHITFEIRPPECGWWRLRLPNFKFYDSKNKQIVEGDVPSYAQFQKIYNLLQVFQLRIFVPDYTERSYQKFFK